jgi:hypothetical protein
MNYNVKINSINNEAYQQSRGLLESTETFNETKRGSDESVHIPCEDTIKGQ